MILQIKSYCGEKIQIQDKMSLSEYRLHPLSVDLLISGFRIYNVEDFPHYRFCSPFSHDPADWYFLTPTLQIP